ncbi:DUF4178 domain-containing protein [Sphingobacterium oryzagri]|uniref:DUF4178 domain-containing protein n=1 Tax=Sphingobacterium oryzagri TaxID=3025669 RepID=A0ABY7WCN3_9SPHI|nr:DUF4178 domain-containing protein [Sphingobacterium sp. KACC 22765]WDF67411.1 DUF4178 domain-containing protein [Sphingobacterium sp. KACC 22765]
MNIQCPQCNHAHSFAVNVRDYQGFVCSNCHSYFKGEGPTDWVFVKRFPKPDHVLWATLGEIMVINQLNHTVITKIQRVDQSGVYSNEYVGVTQKNQTLYLSDGDDYACVLREVERPTMKFRSDKDVRYKSRSFKLTYTDHQRVCYAEGFVFEDLEAESTTSTYIQSDDEDKLISREQIGDREEVYYGEYWDRQPYHELFQTNYQYVERKLAVAKQLYLVGLVIVLVLGAAFYIAHKPYMRAYEFSFDQKFASQASHNQFVGESFVLASERPQNLRFKGISESDQNGILLSIKLVNEETNEVYQTKEIQHFFNDVNYASGVEADFCKIAPGSYHLVFETSAPMQPSTNLALAEDYKLTFGGISYWPLIVIYVLLVLMVLVYRWLFFSPAHATALMRENALHYVDVLKFQKLWLAIGALFALQMGMHYLLQHPKNCSTSTKISTLEDHTYTGSRVHYYRRTYDDYGSSHK